MRIQEKAGRWEKMPNGIGRRCEDMRNGWRVHRVRLSCVLGGGSVACVRRSLLLVRVGSKSGKRKRGRAGIFDFLFLIFFATKI